MYTSASFSSSTLVEITKPPFSSHFFFSKVARSLRDDCTASSFDRVEKHRESASCDSRRKKVKRKAKASFRDVEVPPLPHLPLPPTDARCADHAPDLVL
jgi:hypothetical protein